MENYDWNKRLSEKGPVDEPGVGFTEDLHRRIMAETRAPHRTKRNWKHRAAWAAATAAVLVLAFTTWNLRPNQPNSVTQPQVITDTKTPTEVPFVEAGPGMLVEEHPGEAMDRGTYQYSGHPLVIDPNAYRNAPAERGDVVLFRVPPEAYVKNPNLLPQPNPWLARVVGLPGEKIKIVNSIVYINGKKLDTFYGIETVHGVPQTGYAEAQAPRTPDQWPATNVPEITVPQGSVYLLGDFWFRSIDSRLFGPMPLDKLIGKVLGYKK